MEPIYLDDGLVVAEKPVGLDSEREFPQALEEQIGGKLYPVHRLDKNVSGLMGDAVLPRRRYIEDNAHLATVDA